MKLNRRSLSCFFWLVLLHLSSLCAVAEENQEIAWLEGRFFDVVGTDNRSVSFANVLGEHIAEICQRYLKVGSHNFPSRMLVTLYPEERLNFEENYRIQISPRGQVSLSFRWDESLSFEDICLAFTKSYLTQYARFNYGVGAEERIRFWVLSNLFTRSYLSLRPAQLTNLIRKARESEIPTIQSLLSLSLSEATTKELNLNQGYWLSQVLRDFGLTNSQLSELLDWAIAGVDVTYLIVEWTMAENEENPVTLLEELWQSQAQNYLTQEYEFCDTLEISRLWIAEMNNFDAYRANGGKVDNLMELWDYRNDEILRSVLSARCEIIRLRLRQVNPAYFNTARSLGALYETILESENKHEFISAMLFFLNDWEDAKRLDSRVAELTAECAE